MANGLATVADVVPLKLLVIFILYYEAGGAVSMGRCLTLCDEACWQNCLVGTWNSHSLLRVRLF